MTPPKQATETKLRKALAELVEAQRARERAETEFHAARHRWTAAGDHKRACEAVVARMLAQEQGAVIYENQSFTVDRNCADRVVVERLARELKTEQTTLPLDGAA